MSVYFVKKYLIKIDDRFFTAKKAIQRHIENEHISVFEALLQLNKKDTGLSEIQTELLKLFATGAPDKEIVISTSANSISTIRQHRFKLKEKEKQAKVFLAIMQSFPSKEKRKIILRQYIVTKFEVGRKYNEKEIVSFLKPIHSDYVSIRRYLIAYGFLDRSDDCITYWVKEV
ncbi:MULTISPECIES: DUF2087 domain-containing protein [unclassified Lysinibacillus]|uniref:DUF2087 domain-containing protein n=1 Tax=unclassified Lysinibacillus TaxID=2636778 RepID=UPI003824732C